MHSFCWYTRTRTYLELTLVREQIAMLCVMLFNILADDDVRPENGHDRIEVTRREPCMLQAPGRSLRGEPVILLDAREALFLARGDDDAILHQRRRTVVEEGRDAEDRGGQRRKR